MNETEPLGVSRQRLERALAQRPDDRQVLTQLLPVLEELDAYADLQYRLADAIRQ